MQAAKIRGLGRLFIVFIGLFWGTFIFAQDYYWVRESNPSLGQFPTAKAACGGNVLQGTQTAESSRMSCGIKDMTGWVYTSYPVIRMGNGCEFGMNLTDFSCNPGPPEPCSSKPPVYSAQSCTYIESLKVFSCPTSISYQGCEYISAGGNNCDLATGICTGKWAPTGDNASPDGEECTDRTCAPVPDSGSGSASSGSDMCFTGTDGKIYCISDPDTGCGTYNGAAGCPQPDQNCRSHNGQWVCTDPNKDNRNCSYVKGELVCINPTNPTETIPTESPDHPKNGGNADGNPYNDPTAPGTTVDPTNPLNPQSSDSPATNKTVRDVGDSLGGKLDKANGLLGDILSAIKAIPGGGGGGGGSGDGDGDCPDDVEGCGDGSGDGSGDGDGEQTDLAALIGDKADELLVQRDEESQDFLDSLPQAVEDLFGSDGSAASLGSSALENLFPSHTSCSDFGIPLNFSGKSFSLEIPACELSRVKPLLEWLIWCITLIGLWNILYTGLRQENAKAVKGGF